MAYLRVPFCSPYKLIWPLVTVPTQPGDLIHRAYAQYVWQTYPGRALRVMLTYGLLWPFFFAWLSQKYTRRLGAKVAVETGKSRAQQVAEQFWVALRHSISPKKYYVFELFRPERLRNAGQYLARHELKGGLHNLLESRIEAPTRRILNDKVAFHRHCEAHGLPTVPTFLMVTADGKCVRMADFKGHLPKCDLFFKPVRGRGGRGCERWKWRGGIGYVDQSGTVLPERQLLERILRAATRGPILVQAALQAHEDLRALAMNVLTSCRVMTVRNESGGFEATHAVFKSSTRPEAIVDNFHRGGVVSRVDMRSGRLGPASDAGVGRPCVWHDRHPLTGAQIVGRRLPMWDQVVESVCRAHATLPDRITIGWDVAVTDQGPVILEGNVQSGFDMIQRTHDLPAGMGRLGQCYAHHVRQALGQTTSASFRARVRSGLLRRRARLAARLGLRGLAISQVCRLIHNKVSAGEWCAAQTLPPSRELSREFGIPAPMLDRCLQVAEERGQVARGPLGWRITTPAVRSD